jgi:hypothetical protein
MYDGGQFHLKKALVLMYRKLSLSIIAIHWVIEISVFVAKIIDNTHDNLIFQYLNKIPGFQPKINIFLKNSIFKKETYPMFGAGNVGKLIQSNENSFSYFN